MRKTTVRLGGGSACAEDWIDPAVELAEKGELDYLCFDSLSESELSVVALRRIQDPTAVGYDQFLDDRMRRVLPGAVRNGVKIIGNMGSGDPVGAARRTLEIAAELGITGLKVAAAVGDRVLDDITDWDLVTAEEGLPVNDFGDRLISAHAYVPCDSVVDALAQGADIVLTGRIGDAAMFLAPLVHEFGWAADDWDHRALGIVVGHLMECGGQLTGGYFSDPPYKVVPDMHRLGFPIAEVGADGSVVFSKVEGSGGLLTPATCKEQMIYETTDPHNYLYPDVVIDFSEVGFEQVGPDRVRMTGQVRGRPAPDQLKVALGVREGYYSEATVWYGGAGAHARAVDAVDMVRRRFEHLGLRPLRLRIDLLGVGGMYGDGPLTPAAREALWEVGLRVAVHTRTAEEAVVVVREGTNRLANNGPAGVSAQQRGDSTREIVGYHHTFIPRERVSTVHVVLQEEMA